MKTCGTAIVVFPPSERPHGDTHSSGTPGWKLGLGAHRCHKTGLGLSCYFEFIHCYKSTVTTGKTAIKKKTHVALIILIIALQFDVSTSCNEEIKINEMNKNCILFNIFCILFSSIEGSLWLHSGHVVVYTAILPLPWWWWFPVYLHSGHVVAYFRYGYGSRFSGLLPILTKY